MIIKGLQAEFKNIKDHKYSLLAVVFMLLVVVVISLFGESLAESMQFDRYAIAEGQWWRLYSGSLVHFGNKHTAMNVLGLLAIHYALFWRRHDTVWWLCVILVPLGVGFSLFYFGGDTDIYRGFSAAEYGILLTGLMLEWRHNPWVMSAAIGLLMGKIIYEQMPTYDIYYLKDEIGVAVAVDAHLWGVVSGAVLGLIVLIWQKYRSHPIHSA